MKIIFDFWVNYPFHESGVFFIFNSNSQGKKADKRISPNQKNYPFNITFELNRARGKLT